VDHMCCHGSILWIISSHAVLFLEIQKQTEQVAASDR
jgi:hypothetical protein